MATTTAQSIPIPIPMPAYHQHSHPHPPPPPPHSPHRLLSNRRGSIAASDPWGNHSVLNLNPNRSSSSTLTIVRVTPTTPASSEPPPLDLHTPSSPRRVHRRLGSNGPPTPPAEGGRLSFAFSSFGQSSTTGGPASTSPNTSPKLRPSSPGLHHHHHRSGSSSSASASLSVPLPSNPRLSPDQLFDLARQSTHPQSYSSSFSAGSNLVPPRSRTPNGGRPSSAAINTHEKITPATFTPLPEDIYLPFIDRPAEVAALITTAPSAKLFGLLAQTFPHNLTQSPRSEPALPLPADPLTWTYPQLYHHLTKTTRTILPDAPWVRMVRRCILGRSELIWERVKGALGVPGDLDYEWDDSIGGEFDEEEEGQSMRYDNNEEALDMDSSSSDEQEDGGRKAHGHWEDWDATVDSPASPTQRRSPIVERFHVQEQHKTARERGQSLQDPGVYAGADRVERRRKTDEEQEETLAGVDSALKGILPAPTTNTGTMGSNTTTTDSSSTSSTDSSPVNHLDYTTTNTTTASGHCATTAVTPDANDTALTSAMNPIEVHMQVDIDVHAHANCRGDSTDMDGDTVTAPTPREPSPPPPQQLAFSAPQTHLSIVPLLASSSASSRDRGRQSSPATYSPTNTFHSHHTHTHSHSHSPSNTFSHHSPVNLNINVSLPPLSLPTSLTEISEDVEEEGEDGTPQGESSENDKDPNTEQSGDDVAEGEEDTTLIDPAQIQGLRIATSPMPSSPSALNNPIALGSSYGSSLGMGMSGGSERSASFGSMGGSLSAGVVGAFRRSDSVSSSNEHNTRRYSHGASSMYGRGGEDEDIPYDPVGDRSPGNPLFPSNFARLALGPTLSANNPSLRSPAHPPLPRYGVNPYTSESKSGRSYSSSQAHNLPPVSIHSPGNFGDYRMGMPLSGIGRGNRFNRSSWGGPGSASDYAITVASEGSVGE